MNYKNVIDPIKIQDHLPNIKKRIKSISKLNKKSLSLFEAVIYGSNEGMKKILEEEKARRADERKRIEHQKAIEEEKNKKEKYRKILKELNNTGIITTFHCLTTPNQKTKKSSIFFRKKESTNINEKHNNTVCQEKSKTIKLTDKKIYLSEKSRNTFIPQSNFKLSSTTIPSSSNTIENLLSHRKRDSLPFTPNRRKQFVLLKANDMLGNINGHCRTLTNFLYENKKVDEAIPNTINSLLKVEEEVDDEIKEEVKENPLDTIVMKNKEIVIESICASKIDEQFAFDANKVVKEIFYKKFVINRKIILKKNRELESLKNNRLNLSKKTDNILKEYRKSIIRCYKTLSNFNDKYM